MAAMGDSGDAATATAAWRVRLDHGGIFTGGKLEVSRDGRFFVCMLNDNVVVVSASSGQPLLKLRPDAEDLDDPEQDESLERFTTFCLHPDSKDLISAGQNQLLRRWNIGEIVERKLEAERAETFSIVPGASSVLLERSKPVYPEMLRSWRGHEGPVTCSDFHPLGDLFATGSGDRTVKVWSMKGAYCTHNFRSHRGVLTFLRFHPRTDMMRLASADASGHVWLWDLTQQTDTSKSGGSAGRRHMHLENHVSGVTAVCYGSGGLIFTSGRDKVINVWKKGALLKTFPVLESLEGMQLVKSASEKNPAAQVLATAGERGVVRLWRFTLDSAGGDHRLSCILTQQAPRLSDAAASAEVDASTQFTGLLSAPAIAGLEGAQLVALRADNLIQCLEPETLRRSRQFIGYNDEVIDLQYLPAKEAGARRVVMATNSEQVTLLDLNTFGSELLIGHKDLVLSVDVSREGRFVATGSKDNTCRLWDVETATCVAVGSGHTESVAAVSLLQMNDEVFGKVIEQRTAAADADQQQQQRAKRARVEGKLTPPLLVSASADRTLKYWAHRTRSTDMELVCVHTEIAHEKAINTVATSPNRAIVATGSLDKTIKLWNTADFSLRGTLQGHRRGVWHVQFSPVERCLASASGDKTVRLWSIADLSCLAVLEGHATSVLRVQYAQAGRQVISSASNGVLKVWSIKTSQCVSTLEHHTDKVWAMAMPVVRPGEEAGERAKELLSGGGDARLAIWRDCSEELQQAMAERAEEALLQEQELYTSLRRREFIRAALRALDLNRPFQLRTTLETMMQANAPGQDIATFVKALSHDQLLRLWELVREWNVYARNCALAQSVLEHLLTVDVPLGARATAKAVLEPLTLYSERHFQRVERLLKDSYLLDHVVGCMDNGLVEEASAN